MSIRLMTPISRLVSLLLLIASLGTACLAEEEAATESSGPPPLPIEVEVVATGAVEDSSEFVGTLEAKERVILRPQINGRIIEIFVTEGATVRPGTPIVQLQPDRNQSAVDAAVASVQALAATLEYAKAEVRAAEAEVARLQADVSRQEAELLRQEAEVDLAMINYERTEILVEEGVQPKQELDDRTRDRNTAMAAYEAAAQSLQASRRALDASEERLQASQASVNQQEANLIRAEAEANINQEDLGYTQVAAPIDGMIGTIPVEIGDYVQLGGELTSIIRNDPLDLTVAIPVERTSQLELGLPVEILDAQDQTIVTGSMSFISPEVDQNVQAVLAKATFPNPTGFLRDGQYVRAKVIWDQQDGVLIPSTAISRIGAQSFVFVVAEGDIQGSGQPIAQQRPVQLGTLQGNRYPVLEGLESGDTIAISNILKLRNGVPVQPES